MIHCPPQERKPESLSQLQARHGLARARFPALPLRFGHNSVGRPDGGNGIPLYEIPAMRYDVGRLSIAAVCQPLGIVTESQTVDLGSQRHGGTAQG